MDARDTLLADVVAHAATHGLAEPSLRSIAAAIGTSHRMLLYHFGSREGLVAAVVAAVEEQQRALMDELAGTAAGPAELIRAVWAQTSAPEVLPFVALFFEAVAQAAMGRPGTGGFLASVTTPWVERARQDAAALGIDADDADLRVGIAVTRGLLIDVLGGADRRAADAALDRFVAMWEASAG